jgi:hypothetical protein
LVTSQPAGRRIPLRLWLVSGDALGERDDRTIVTDRSLSTFAALTNRTVGKSVDGRSAYDALSAVKPIFIGVAAIHSA